MPLIYITGTPGTGKTTIQNELKKRGYEAHDIDEPRFGGPVNLKTGEKANVPPIRERSPTWFEEHEWRVSREGVGELLDQSESKTIFLCGVASTDELVWDLFDKIFFLNINEETLKHRVANRKDNDYGKSDSELQHILKRYSEDQANPKYKDSIKINANNSIEETIEEIIEKSKS